MLYGLDIQNRKICQVHSNSFCPSRLKYHRICDREFFSQNIHSFSFILKFLPPENLSTCMVASDCLLPSSWWKHVVYAIATNHKMNCWLDNFVFYDKLCEKNNFAGLENHVSYQIAINWMVNHIHFSTGRGDFNTFSGTHRFHQRCPWKGRWG